MISVNDFKPGITFQINGNLYIVIQASHSKQGRGQANVKAKIKDLRTHSTIIKSFIGGEKVKKAHIERIVMNFLYNDGINCVFMDIKTFEQIELKSKKFEWELNFLNEGTEINIKKFESEILDLEIPLNIDMEVIDAIDTVKGNTVTKPQKKVKLSTGFEVEVPMFIKKGDIITIVTETGKYVSKGRSK